jgi:sugar/nucleoside kinase (ribokinase family)
VTLSTEQSRKTCLKAVKVARDAGSVISFDANLRPGLWSWQTEQAKKPIMDSMKLSHIVKLSEEELYFLAGIDAKVGDIHRDDPKTIELMERLVKETGVALLFVTFGKDGCRWQGKAGAGFLDTIKVKPVDTTGAGDCFMAGTLYQFLSLNKEPSALTAEDYRAMARRGVASGSLSTEKRGGIPSVPTLEEVAARMPS